MARNEAQTAIKQVLTALDQGAGATELRKLLRQHRQDGVFNSILKPPSTPVQRSRHSRTPRPGLERACQSAGDIIWEAVAPHPSMMRKLAGIMRIPIRPRTARIAALTMMHATARTPNPVPNNRQAIVQRWESILSPRSQERFVPTIPLALEIIRAIPPEAAKAAMPAILEGSIILSRAREPGKEIQELVPSRKHLAVYHTRPESAVLMARMAIPASLDWGNPEIAGGYRISDYSAGTGTLLLAAARRVRELHAQAGGNPRDIHQTMMERSITAIDVLPASVAIAAAELDALEGEPHAASNATCAIPLRLGPIPNTHGRRGRPPKNQEATRKIGLGALDLLNPKSLRHQDLQPISREGYQTPGPDLTSASQDLVIMNPPFTQSRVQEIIRITNHGWNQVTQDEQELLQERMMQVRTAAKAEGQSSLALHFSHIAHRMTSPGGTIALLLPGFALKGGTTGVRGWPAFRRQIARHYRDVVVISIAGFDDAGSTFSHDTQIPEVMIIARKKGKGELPGSGLPGEAAAFINLTRPPQDEEHAARIADAAAELARELRKSPENIPHPLLLDDKPEGNAILVELPQNGAPWRYAGVMDPRLANLAGEMKPGTTFLNHIPLASLGETASLAPTRPSGKNDGRTNQEGTPILQDHRCSTQRSLETQPTGNIPDRQAATSRLHLNTNLRYNSQATAASTTPEPSAGGKFWPTLITRDEQHEKAIALWMNTTLGLIAHWNSANHTQHGLGYLSNLHARAMPVLAANRLRDEQLRELEEIFEQVRDLPMLPASEAWKDQVRIALDRRVLTVLGAGRESLERVEQLRYAWCLEPTVAGRKGKARARQPEMNRLRELNGVR